MTELTPLRRHGNVDLFALETVLETLAFELPFLLLYHLLDRGTHLVCHCADGGSLLCGERTHSAKNGGELTFLSEQLYTELLKRLRAVSRAELSHGGLTNLFEFFFHFHNPFLLRKQS